MVLHAGSSHGWLQPEDGASGYFWITITVDSHDSLCVMFSPASPICLIHQIHESALTHNVVTLALKFVTKLDFL